ncbi:DNA polymerase delta small subunit [Coniochaeta sp. 2T2.1]|nr:DNA polymerase delta small subunit [Coniochaeta sp. 2T2.1]
MVAFEDVESSLLGKPSDDTPDVLERTPSNYAPLKTFELEKGRQYQQQYADIYFLRLTKIKPAVEEVAAEEWDGLSIGNEKARRVERVLDVRQGELCYVAGTIYVDMPLKPNVMDDVSKDRWIGAPTTVQKYFSDDGTNTVSLEDDSGRITLIGSGLSNVLLVTGCIVAVMGTENVNGEFEVIDIKFPDLAPQPDRWALSSQLPSTTTTISTKKGKSSSKQKEEDVEMSDAGKTTGGKIAIVSGLEFSGTDNSYAMELDLLLEYLLGEALDPATQSELSHISRLIIAGNSIAADRKTAQEAADPMDKKSYKKYGYDSKSYNAQPSHLFDEFLDELLPSIPVTLLPGALDPANSSYPQQPIHTAMFPKSRSYAAVPGRSAEPGWFDAATNPLEMEVEGWRVLGTGGQNVDDMAKYVDSDDRLGMMEAMCRWRCSAPTAPDTLSSYPFQDDEPFVMTACPHLYFVGCQPEFGTKVIQGPDGQMVRLITVPSFSTSREIVLVDTETLDVSRVKIAAVGSV